MPVISSLHLIDDARPGGVHTNLQQLLEHVPACEKHYVIKVEPLNFASVRRYKAKNIIVHFSMAWAKLPYLIALRAINPRTRLILQEHHYSREHFDPSPRIRARFAKLMTMACKLFNRVVSVSEEQARWYESIGIPINAVINPMTALDSLLELPSRKIAGNPVVGVSGRLDKSKGLDTVLELLETSIAKELDFLIAGFGELKKDVEEAALSNENVRFMGAYQSPEEYLAQCDLVLVPSRLDTFGLAALEAKAAGKPIVVSRVGGLATQANGCGISVEPADPAALAEGLTSILKNEQLRTLGRKGRHAAIKHNTTALHQWAILLSREESYAST